MTKKRPFIYSTPWDGDSLALFYFLVGIFSCMLIFVAGALNYSDAEKEYKKVWEQEQNCYPIPGKIFSRFTGKSKTTPVFFTTYKCRDGFVEIGR